MNRPNKRPCRNVSNFKLISLNWRSFSVQSLRVIEPIRRNHEWTIGGSSNHHEITMERRRSNEWPPQLDWDTNWPLFLWPLTKAEVCRRLKLIEGKKEKETEQKSEVQTEGEKSSKIKRKNDDNFSEREKDDELEKERKRTVNKLAIERCQLSGRHLTWGIGIGDGDERWVLICRWGFPTGDDGVSNCNERRNDKDEEMNGLTSTVVYRSGSWVRWWLDWVPSLT